MQAAEILVDDVKNKISPLKIKSDEWLKIMEYAHNLDIKSSATMMYGTVENDDDIINHLMKIRDLPGKNWWIFSFYSMGI